MSENLALNLTLTAASAADRPALSRGETVLTYGQLDDASARVAALLAGRGVQPGDRVGIMLPNVPQFVAAYYGVLRAGAVVVPMNVLLKRREVAFYLGDPGARLLLAWEDFADEAQAGAADAGAQCIVVRAGEFEQLLQTLAPVAAVAPRAASDTAVILYTSGTTGTPKGAELSHANIGRNVEIVLGLFRIGAGDIVLGALPLFHTFGQTCGMNAAVAAGATLALVPRFDPELVLGTIERERVTVFEGVPTMYAALLHHPGRERFDTSTLRICACGGASLPVEVLHGFEAAFGCVVLEGYGLSETSPVACFNHPDLDRRPGSIGVPVEGVEMRLVDSARVTVAPDEIGEIAIRGHNVMKGYWGRPDATADAIDADGWFYSGDLARVDEAGRYFIVDRKKDMIIRGGYNIYPREIEEILYEHAAVREAAVIGLRHAELGEEVGAAVVLKAGAQASESDLRDWVRSQVAAYKYPRHVWFVDELPKGPTGKILKRAIQVPAQVVEGH